MNLLNDRKQFPRNLREPRHELKDGQEIQIINPEINGKYLKEIHFHQNISVILIKRDNEMKIPHGDSILNTGDVLFVIGTNTALEETVKAFS